MRGPVIHIHTPLRDISVLSPRRMCTCMCAVHMTSARMCMWRDLVVPAAAHDGLRCYLERHLAQRTLHIFGLEDRLSLRTHRQAHAYTHSHTYTIPIRDAVLVQEASESSAHTQCTHMHTTCPRAATEARALHMGPRVSAPCIGVRVVGILGCWVSLGGTEMGWVGCRWVKVWSVGCVGRGGEAPAGTRPWTSA